jgi:hypothetical protein
MADTCRQCGALDVKVLKCSQCMRVWYCSKECQRTDWTTRHREECVRYAEERVRSMLSEEEVSSKVKAYVQRMWLKDERFSASLIALYECAEDVKGVFSLAVDHAALDGRELNKDGCPYAFYVIVGRSRMAALGQYVDLALSRERGKMHVWVSSTRRPDVPIISGSPQKGIVLHAGNVFTLKVPGMHPEGSRVWFQRIREMPKDVLERFRSGGCHLYPGEEGLRMIAMKATLHG